MIKGNLRTLFAVVARTKGMFRARGFLRRTEGAELVEFALALPMVVVMMVGLLDFAHAYHLKQELANAAREGARLGCSQPTSDIDNSSQPSVVDIRDDVTTYLANANVDTSFIGTTMSYNTTTYVGTYYTTSNGSNYGLKIERYVKILDSTGLQVPAVRVTLTYPYDWTFGFNHLIQFLIPSAAIGGTITITTDAAMPWLG